MEDWLMSNKQKRLLLTRVLIRHASIFHKTRNTTWFNNNNNMG